MKDVKSLKKAIEIQEKIFDKDFSQGPFSGTVQELAYCKRISFSRLFTKSNDKVLSVGCGDGTIAKGVSDAVKKVVAIDISQQAINVAKKFNNSLNIFYVKKNIEDFNPEEKLNIALLFEVVEHLFQPKEVLSKIYNILSDEGIILISTPNYDRATRKVKKLPIINFIRKLQGKNSERINCDHFQEYTYKQLEDFLNDAGFTVIQREGIIFWTNTIGGNMCKNIRWLQKINFYLGSLFPSIAGHIYIAAQKSKGKRNE